MYDAECYDLLDAIKSNVMEFIWEDDNLEMANLLERIFHDIEATRTRLNKLEKESKELRYRAVKAEMRVSTLETELEGH